MGTGVKGLTLKADSAVKHGGRTSATIINAGDGSEPYNWRQEINRNLPLGKTVKLTGWVKTKDVGNSAAVAIQLLDRQGRMVAFHTTQHEQPFRGTAEWKPFSLEFVVPQPTVRMAVLAMLQGRGQAWFDDFEMIVEE